MLIIILTEKNEVNKMTINNMKKGERAVVASFDGLNDSFVARLMDVGLYKHSEITLLNIIAMGKLFLLEVDEVEICIRSIDASRIVVNKI